MESLDSPQWHCPDPRCDFRSMHGQGLLIHVAKVHPGASKNNNAGMFVQIKPETLETVQQKVRRANERLHGVTLPMPFELTLFRCVRQVESR
jgi:hypothetical protein